VNKRLLFVVNVDWFFISHRLPIAIQAMKEGFEVHLICAITTRAGYLRELGIFVHPLSFSRSGKSVSNEVVTVIKLYRLIKQIKPDLLHLITIKPVLYGGIIARLAKIPRVVSAISGLGLLFVQRASFSAKLFRSAILVLYRLAMGHANQRVIFQNPTDMKVLVDSGGVDKKKVRMIRGSGVNLNDYPMMLESGEVPVIVMASRLLRDKGVVEFIEAATILKDKGVNAHFQLVGETDSENPESVTKEQVDVWQQDGVVECLGYRTDIAHIFSQAHIVTLPSYYGEGLPKVLIEAAACGRAVITTDMPGCRDAIEPNVSGMLVTARDSHALAEMIEYLIEDNNLRKKMGKAGRALAEREFSIDKVVNAHFDIYHELEMNN
jgi:glycosyltransferase involved in cell wall biosynthesis